MVRDKLNNSAASPYYAHAVRLRASSLSLTRRLQNTGQQEVLRGLVMCTLSSSGGSGQIWITAPKTEGTLSARSLGRGSFICYLEPIRRLYDRHNGQRTPEPREERALFNLARPNLMLLPLSYLIFLETGGSGANRGAAASQSAGKMPSWLRYVTAERLFNQRPLARAHGHAINFGSEFQPL